ncbi:hypothetical protein HMPREF1567_2252 [Providencia alcalifaciens PAL-2]|nr:hypothetical protein HMPREF1567_2252 [Providencia alcalifaciens PAL-2]
MEEMVVLEILSYSLITPLFHTITAIGLSLTSGPLAPQL